MFKTLYHPVIHFWTLWFSEAMIYFLKENSRNIKSNESIADIGCGMGYHCFQMLRYKPEYVAGLDISAETIDFLKSFTNNIYFDTVDISNIKTEKYNERFSVIFCSDVYEHVDDPQVMLINVFKMLKRNGTACILSQLGPSWEK